MQMTFSYMWREHRYLTGVAVILFVIATSLSGQNLYHPRAVAMGGAFTAIPDGLFSVSSNPANLAFRGDYRSYWYLAGADWQMTNNFFSLQTSSKYGGKDITIDGGQLQQELIEDLPENGWRMSYSINLPLPILNFSRGNHAFTSKILYNSEYYISRPALDVIFGDWEKGVEYQTDLRIDAMTAIEYAYSMGIPYDNLAFGFSIKYYQGLGYYGLDPDFSSGTILVDTSAFLLTGTGDFLFRQSSGGKGVGVDLGVTYRDKSGLDLGFCVQNIAGLIRWNDPSVSSKRGTAVLETMGKQVTSGILKNSDVDLPFKGESYRYQFSFRNVAAQELFRDDSSYSDFFQSQTEIIAADSSIFITRLPLVFRFGLAQQVRENLLLAMDFSTSFRNRFSFNQGWRVSIGAEYTYLHRTPFRFGMAFGDVSGWEINLGSGLHLGPVHLDWAVGFHRGIWLHTTKGLHFSLSSYLTGKYKSRY